MQKNKRTTDRREPVALLFFQPPPLPKYVSNYSHLRLERASGLWRRLQQLLTEICQAFILGPLRKLELPINHLLEQRPYLLALHPKTLLQLVPLPCVRR